MAATMAANDGAQDSYGLDPMTAAVRASFSELFDQDCDVHFVGTGVAANGLSLAGLCQPYDSIICARYAHVLKDEGGAIPFFTGGSTLMHAERSHEKLLPADVYEIARRRNDIHFQQPRAVSLTQATECGTVYSPTELEAVIGAAKSCGLLVHVDGARLANAAARLGKGLLPQLGQLGGDVVTFGGTKNGGLFGDTIVVLNAALGHGIARRVKQAGHQVAKTRFMAAAWSALLVNDVWLRNAAHANMMAVLLADRVSRVPGITVAYPVEANSVLIEGDADLIRAIHDELPWRSYGFIRTGMLRFTCAWNTTIGTVEGAADAIARLARSRTC
jgi:threonine aldolase